MDKQVKAYISEETKVKIQKESKRLGVSESTIIKIALDNHLPKDDKLPFEE